MPTPKRPASRPPKTGISKTRKPPPKRKSHKAQGPGAPPAHRPTDYTDALAYEFCRRIASGHSVRFVCAEPDMPDEATIYRWRHDREDFREKIARAREDRTEFYADQVLGIGAGVLSKGADAIDPHKGRVAIYAVEVAQKMQAPKVRVEMSGPGGGPISVAHDLKALSDKELNELERLTRKVSGAG